MLKKGNERSLYEYRGKKGYSLEKLFCLANLSIYTVLKIRRCVYQNFKLRTSIKIIRVIGVVDNFLVSYYADF